MAMRQSRSGAAVSGRRESGAIRRIDLFAHKGEAAAPADRRERQEQEEPLGRRDGLDQELSDPPT